MVEPQAERVFVRIEKLDRGPFALGVEIVRSRDGVSYAGQTHQEAPHPRVLFLTNEAIASLNLKGWIDALASRDAPLIICAGAADLAAPQTGHAMTQRRIDLLAIEQNAWVLAATDLRCKVVETRTELDWAMKNGQICVWAPSKIVLDAVDGPSTNPRDALALAVWFASEIQAKELFVIGADAPEAGIPVQAIRVDQPALP